MDFKFGDQQASDDSGGGGLYTAIGVIDVFEVSDVIYDKNSNGNESLEIHFKRDKDEFRDYFYLTDKAVPKFLNLYEKFTGDKSPPATSDAIKASLMGKKSGLKVWGKINNTNGKVTSCLNFAGFGFPVADLEKTSWTPWEEGKISGFQDALKEYLATKKKEGDSSDSNGSAPPPTTESAGF